MRKSAIVPTPEKFSELTELYFTDCKDNDEPITMTGLVLALGFCSRQSQYDYSKQDGFEDVVNRAKLMIEHSYELKLHNIQVTGPIFALKNFGWSDKQELSLSGNVSHKDESEAVLNALKNKHK